MVIEMKLGLLTWKDGIQKNDKHLIERGFMIIEERSKSERYIKLKDKWDALKVRSIDQLMFDNFPEDFNYFLDFINPKDFKKQSFDLIGNKNTTGFLNFAASQVKKGRVLYGPTFYETDVKKDFHLSYDKFAMTIARSQKCFVVDSTEDNALLDMTDARLATGNLYGGDANSFIDVLNTDYQPYKLKGKILLIDGLSSHKSELRRQLTALNQKKVFVGVKGVIFGQIKNLNLKEFVKVEFTELTRLNIVYDFMGANTENQSYVMLGKKVKIDPITKTIIQFSK
jgi:muramoyltetrapeptide carboxypeptidase LdcA involved in peptidoglycan recycling